MLLRSVDANNTEQHTMQPPYTKMQGSRLGDDGAR